MKSAIEWFIDRIEIAVVIVAMAILVTWISIVASETNKYQERNKLDHQRMISGYTSPAERTDTDRLDWLDKHRDQTPWVMWGSDPRRELDYAIDAEAAK